MTVYCYKKSDETTGRVGENAWGALRIKPFHLDRFFFGGPFLEGGPLFRGGLYRY